MASQRTSKTNNDRYKLTWLKATKRWQKKYKGKRYYFSGEGGKEASYRAAWQAWLKQRAEIDGAAEMSMDAVSRQLWAEQIKWIADTQNRLISYYHDSTEARAVWRHLESLRLKALDLLAAGQPFESADFDKRHPVAIAQQLIELHRPQIKPDAMPEKYDIKPAGVELTQANLHDVDSRLNLPAPPPEPLGEPPWAKGTPDQVTTLSELCRAFMQAKQKEADRNPRHQKRVDRIGYDINDLKKAAGDDLSLSLINAQTLGDYRDRIKDQVHEKKIAAATGRDRLRTIKQLMMWAADNQFLTTLPGMLNRGFTVEVSPKAIKTLSVADVQKCMAEASDRTELYILLSLNTGMTQQDIADLRKDEVNWQDGTLTRKRSKTKKHADVPTVTYRLWPETLKMLNAQLASEGELVLTSREGNPLITGNTDSIRSAYRRLVEKTGIDIGPKLLRKTAASKLEEHDIYSRHVQLYLGHSEKTIAGRHYAKPAQESFDQAITWLHDQFITKPTKKAKP